MNWLIKYSIVLVLTMVSMMAQAQEENRFVEGISDLPLHQAFELLDEPLIFDSADGRIIEVTYVTQNSQLGQQEVIDYYQELMTQLGWQSVSPQIFEREGEQLSLEFEMKHGEMQLTFILRPIS